MARTPVSRPPLVVRGAVNPNPVDRPRTGRGSRGGFASKREKFETGLEVRGGQLKAAFANFRKLANKEVYEHTAQDLEFILAELRTEIEFIEKSFKAGREISPGFIVPRLDKLTGV